MFLLFLYVCYVTILSLQGFHCFIVGLLHHRSVRVFDCLFLCFLRHYCFIICLLRHHTIYLFKASIASLSVCYITALFYASTVTSSVSYVTNLSLQDFHCFIICLLRYCSILGFAGPFLCIFCCVSRLSLHGLNCFIICLLSQCSVLDFDCSFLSLLRITIYSGYLYVIIPSFQDFHCFLSVYYLFITSLLCSRLHYIYVYYVTIGLLSLQCFHYCSICLLRHHSVVGLEWYFHCLLRHLTISSRFPFF